MMMMMSQCRVLVTIVFPRTRSRVRAQPLVRNVFKQVESSCVVDANVAPAAIDVHFWLLATTGTTRAPNKNRQETLYCL